MSLARFTMGTAAFIFAMGAAGCSSDDDTTPTPPTTATPDSGTSTSTLSLYDRLGGKSGLESFVKTVVETKILKDADLSTYFFAQVAKPIPAGSPSATQIVVCFGRLIGAALEKDTYPGAAVSDPTNTNNPNHTCRDMASSHKPFLNIGDKTFDKFIGLIAESLQPLVKPTATKAGEITQAEFATLAGALTATKSSIVVTTAPAGPGPFVKP